MLNLSLFLFSFSPLIQPSIQQSPVLGDLHFQPHLDVQQQVVLAFLVLEGGSQLLQLHLQSVDGQLQLAELNAVSTLRFL